MDEKIKKAFDEIRAEQALKTSTKYFIYEKFNAPSENKKSSSIRKPLSAVVAVFALLLCAAIFTYSIPVSAISVDSDTGSVELGVNCFDKVVKVTCFDDGCEFEDKGLRNKNYKDAVSIVLENDKSATLTVSCKNGNECEKMAEEIRNCKANDDEPLECVTGHHGTSEAAHEHGISTGKYNAYLQLKEYEPEITVEEIKGLSMKEIRQRISAHCDSDDTKSTDVSCEPSHAHNKEGHGAGNGKNHHGNR